MRAPGGVTYMNRINCTFTTLPETGESRAHMLYTCRDEAYRVGLISASLAPGNRTVVPLRHNRFSFTQPSHIFKSQD